MPRFDGTGPRGMGPGTGWGVGPCGAGGGWGRGFGRGLGRFCPWLWGAAFGPRRYRTRSEELEDLQEEAKDLEADLKAVREQIDELQSQNK